MTLQAVRGTGCSPRKASSSDKQCYIGDWVGSPLRMTMSPQHLSPTDRLRGGPGPQVLEAPPEQRGAVGRSQPRDVVQTGLRPSGRVRER